MKPRAAAALRSPLLHFLLLGAALHLAASLLPAGWSFGREVLVVGEADLQQMRQDWIRSSGRPPTPAQLQASVWRWAGDEALFREALRREMDRDDPVVNQRLLRNLRFADPGRADDPGELLRAARALGMVRHDPVVRRRLIQRMEQDLVGGLRVEEAELRAYIAAHPQRYARPARYAFDNVFIAADGFSPQAEGRARAIGERLRAGVIDAGSAGDAFPLPGGEAAQSPAEIGRRLGPPIADAVVGAPVGEWVGPVASAFGWHLLRVTRTVDAADADLDVVREPAARALRAERREQRLQAARTRMASRYRIELPAGVVMELP